MRLGSDSWCYCSKCRSLSSHRGKTRSLTDDWARQLCASPNSAHLLCDSAALVRLPANTRRRDSSDHRNPAEGVRVARWSILAHHSLLRVLLHCLRVLLHCPRVLLHSCIAAQARSGTHKQTVTHTRVTAPYRASSKVSLQRRAVQTFLTHHPSCLQRSGNNA